MQTWTVPARQRFFRALRDIRLPEVNLARARKTLVSLLGGLARLRERTTLELGNFADALYETSCSSPVIGAIFTMVNDARIAAGTSTISFINPTVSETVPQRTLRIAVGPAQSVGAFNEITIRDNPGRGTSGYNATVGWDPATGLETPNFPKLPQAWLALP
jgi:hypothetical protein